MEGERRGGRNKHRKKRNKTTKLKNKRNESRKDTKLNKRQKEWTRSRVACVFITLVHVSRNRELSEALPRSVSINKTNVGG